MFKLGNRRLNLHVTPKVLLDETVLLMTDIGIFLEYWPLLLCASEVWSWLNCETAWENVLIVALDLLILLIVLMQWLNKLLIMFLVRAEAWWWSLVRWELLIVLELR